MAKIVQSSYVRTHGKPNAKGLYLVGTRHRKQLQRCVMIRVSKQISAVICIRNRTAKSAARNNSRSR